MSSQSPTNHVEANPNEGGQAPSSNLPDILRPRIRLEDFRPPTLQAPETPRPFYIDPDLLAEPRKHRLHPRSMFAGALAGIAGVLVGVIVASLLRPPPVAVPTPIVATQARPTSAIVLAPTATFVPTAIPEPTAQATLTPAPAPTQAAAVLTAVGARPLPGAPRLAPFFSANYDPNDGRPVFVCALVSFGSYLTALQIQSSGLDRANGFHLGIIPEGYGNEYELTFGQVSTGLRDGRLDCYFDTLDNLARTGHGKLTAIVDESAGGDGIYARDIATIYDLRGKRIAYESDGSTEFFLRHVLFIAQIPPGDVTLMPMESIDDAVAAFISGDADAFSGYDPYFAGLDKAGGKKLIMSDSLRIIVDGIVTSDRAIKERPEVVQAFHNAWFAALKRQAEDVDAAAADIAAFGHADWSKVRPETPSDSFRALMGTIAQADLGHNATLMREPKPLFVAMDTAQGLWREVISVTERPLADLIAPQFVLSAAAQADLRTERPMLNPSFSLATPDKAAAPAVAELPCSRFSFEANSAQLTDASKRVIDLCVLPALRQRENARMTVTGSAAWPAPVNAYSEQAIQELARKRAHTIVDYLRTHGIDMRRLTVAIALPPELNRGSDDPEVLASDRVVRMTIELNAR